MEIKEFNKEYSSEILDLITKEFGKQSDEDVSEFINPAFDELYREKKYYILFEKEKLIGVYGFFSAKEQPRNVLFIGWFILHPDYRKKGIGSTLLKKIEDAANELRKKFIYVVSYQSAIGFYSRHGFKKSRASKLKEFYFSNNCVLLYKTLNK